MLREMDGRIAALDLSDQNCMTFYHHVEEMNNAPYRYHKTFTGPYTDAAGTTGIRTYGLFVRDLERRVLTHVDPAGELLWRAGLYAGFRENEGCGLRTISARKMYEFVSGILASGNAKNVLYRIEGETP
jgi:aminoglycoside 3-N-acetyltransferase